MHSLNWDDLRVFLAVSRAARFSLAAHRLGIDHTTVARRVTALETALAARLVDRAPTGITLTADGVALAAYAERIEREAIGIGDALGGAATRLTGTVRLATPEAFGALLLAPHVDRFTARYPEIELELVAESRIVRVSQREADLAIGLARPPNNRLIARRLADYRLGLYATAGMVARIGPIRTPADLAGQPMVWYIPDLIDFPELRGLADLLGGARIVFRSNSIMAQQNAVAAGVGVGLLHAFAASRDPRLVPVLPEAVTAQRSYWLTMPPELQHLPRIRAVVCFIEELLAEHREHFTG